MSEEAPSKVYGNSPTSTSQSMPVYIPDTSLRGESWDQLLQNRGIRFIHRRATPCPNMTNLDDNNHLPNCPICDDVGILHYAQREIFGIFQSNSIEKTFEQQGVWEVGSAVVSLPSVYSDGTQADFNTFDELLIPDFEVRLWELKQFYSNQSSIQRLRYPIINIDYIAVIRNNVLVAFTEGVDYIITAGNIEWLVGGGPQINPTTGMGEVYTVSYFANPVYRVLQPLRELRVSQEMVAGVKQARRLPQQVLVKRDFLITATDKYTGT